MPPVRAANSFRSLIKHWTNGLGSQPASSATAQAGASPSSSPTICYHATAHFSGATRVVTLGSEQYVWHGADASAHADPELPPVVSSVDASAETVFTLPKASVTVLRGKVAGLTT
jgi:hypothetical protein